MENIHTLYKLCSGMSYSAAGTELKVNESTILNNVSLTRNTHNARLCTDQLINCDERLTGA